MSRPLGWLFEVLERGGVVSLQPTHQMKALDVQAYRWFKNGDHPADGGGLSEGRVVRYYRRPGPELSDDLVHDECGYRWHDHGWIDAPDEGHIVCPGDWVLLIVGSGGEPGIIGDHFVVKPTMFADLYESIGDALGSVEDRQAAIRLAMTLVAPAIGNFVIGATPNLDHLPTSQRDMLIAEATLGYLIGLGLVALKPENQLPLTLAMRVPVEFTPDTAAAARAAR